MKTYRIAKGYRILLYLALSLFIIGGTSAYLMHITSETLTLDSLLIISFFTLFLDALMIIGLVDTYKSKFIITEDHLQSQGVFTNRKLKRNEVEGFLYEEHYIFIVPKNASFKKLKVSKQCERFKELETWLHTHYDDIVQVVAKKEEKKILQSDVFGPTEQERKKSLIKARRVAKLLNWLSYIAGVSTIIFHYYVQYVTLLPLVLPLLALGAIAYFKGLIKIDGYEGSATANVAPAIIVSAFTLLLIAVIDFNIINYLPAFFYGLVIGVICILFLLRIAHDFNFKERKTYIILFGFTVFFAIYGFGSAIIINCAYDARQPDPYLVTVLDKETEYDDRTIYRLELAAWELMPEITEQEVKRSVYEGVEIGEEVKVYYKDGLLGIPWLVIQ